MFADHLPGLNQHILPCDIQRTADVTTAFSRGNGIP